MTQLSLALCGLGGKIIHNKRPDERPFCYSQYAEPRAWCGGTRMVVATAVARCAVRVRSRRSGRGATPRRRRGSAPGRPVRPPAAVTGTISGGDNRRTNKTLKETMMLAAGTGTAFTEDCHCVHEFTPFWPVRGCLPSTTEGQLSRRRLRPLLPPAPSSTSLPEAAVSAWVRSGTTILVAARVISSRSCGELCSSSKSGCETHAS